MADWRRLYKCISTSIKLSKVSDAADLLYIRLIAHQDDWSIIPGEIEHLQFAVVPNKKWTSEKCEKALMELVNVGLILYFPHPDDADIFKKWEAGVIGCNRVSAGVGFPFRVFIEIVGGYEKNTPGQGKKRRSREVPENKEKLYLGVIECNWVSSGVIGCIDKTRLDETRTESEERETEPDREGGPSLSPPGNPDILETFEFWNSQKETPTHRNLDKFRNPIQAALKIYKADEVKRGIQNYCKAIRTKSYGGSKWTWSGWTLTQFLSQNNGLEKFINDDKGGAGKYDLPANCTIDEAIEAKQRQERGE